MTGTWMCWSVCAHSCTRVLWQSGDGTVEWRAYLSNVPICGNTLQVYKGCFALLASIDRKRKVLCFRKQGWLLTYRWQELTLASVTLNSLRMYWGMLYSAIGSTTKYWYLAERSAGQYWWHFSWRAKPNQKTLQMCAWCDTFCEHCSVLPVPFLSA